MTKSQKKTILVSGASGVIGYGILKSLQNTNHRLIGTTIYDDSIAPFFSDIVEKVPSTNDSEYINSLINIINKHKVDMIIPGIEIDVIKWAKHIEEITKQTNAKVLLNNPSLIELCSDKWLFYQKLKKHNSIYAIPTFLEIDDNIQYPLILKPRCGSSSKGIVIAHNQETLNLHKCEIGENLMIQPLIGTHNEEFTVSAFFDNKSNLCHHICLRRTLSKEGFTQTAETIEIDNIKSALTDIASIFNPIGPTNFQFRVSNSQLKILEINPRISSATSIRTAFGYNESLMSVRYFLEDITPEETPLKKGRAVRYTEEKIYYEL